MWTGDTAVLNTATLLFLQRAWRKHLQKRASRALAMMMLRAKVRRAHRAAYVSNLLRRKTPGVAGSTAGGGGEGDSSTDGALDAAGVDEDEVELTQQEQEQELQQALQHVLEEGQLSMADIAELQLSDLIQKVTAAKEGSGGGARDSDSEGEEEEDEEQAAGWKVLSKPTSPVKVRSVTGFCCGYGTAQCSGSTYSLLHHTSAMNFIHGANVGEITTINMLLLLLPLLLAAAAGASRRHRDACRQRLAGLPTYPWHHPHQQPPGHTTGLSRLSFRLTHSPQHESPQCSVQCRPGAAQNRQQGRQQQQGPKQPAHW
jgi:hypothetical protein